MDVANPRRILAVSLDTQADQLSRVIKDLTGSSPGAPPPSLAGTTHSFALKTRYYSATVPIWLDLVASPAEWSASFLSAEAAEVLAVLGGLVVVFALPPPSSSSESAPRVRELIRHVGRVVNDGLGGWEWDGVRLAVGVGAHDSDGGGGGDAEDGYWDWDELCAEAALEFVRIGARQQPDVNELGGIPRVREALESNDYWAQDAPSDFGDFEDAPDKDDADGLDFGLDGADLEGLRRAIWDAGPRDEPLALTTDPGAAAGAGADEDVDVDVDEVENMMRRLQAVRDAGEGLPDAQRRRMAARAVGQVLRDLG
ncbi:Alpha/gamma-adaptin-binding protein p34 [Metarhizium album ARSEF 1941]|uniref:Alpha/gamma-adaptin-binding protein p34 n=1 Tax=Metarhizium album (strain ARSEF 1941) TaxID=1081103 RepID=A0A0B2WMJ4_METAS|nr:Alpha/gamma-adaptin-binding protein p34 [Metarhizium album ARSEF 1941]KHN94914.1 Alpha/gamma-adaptin-binding protein p34 [Metarhizium album ARSEF 1941]